MTVKISEPQNYTTWFDIEDMMQGKAHLRELIDKDTAYDVAQFEFWRAYLENLALAGFKWEGLPAGIDSRAIEYIMLHFGMGALFAEDGGLLFAQASPANQLNLYYNPNEINLYSPAGQYWQRHCNFWVNAENEVMPRDAVMLFDNMTRKPLEVFITNYAQRLARIDRVIDLNVSAQKTPWIITGPEEAKSTKKAIIKKLESNAQFISQNTDMGNIVTYDVLNTQAPYVADKLLDAKKRILDEAVTFLGADNANTDKRERVNTQEVLSNNEQVMLMRNSRLKCRQEFCRYANVVFGDMLNEEINVKWSVPHLRESEAPNVTESVMTEGDN